MGSIIEINDTVKLKRGPHLPANLVPGETYTFALPGRRLFHMTPTRVFLVEEIDGLWNFIGQAVILEQTIDAIHDETRGRYQVVTLYPPDHVKMLNRYDAPRGKGYGV